MLGRMNEAVSKLARCAVYTRKSTEYNLELAFNSLDAQREACEAYIKSQAHEGWRAIPGRYDDGAFSGASLDRPALQQLLADVRAGTIDIVLVYKVDRLTRSLAKLRRFAPSLRAICGLARSACSLTISGAEASAARLETSRMAAASAGARSEWGRWPICSRTASTSVMWSTEVRFIPATTRRSSIAIC